MRKFSGLALLLLVAVAGCGGGGDKNSSSTPDTTPTTATPAASEHDATCKKLGRTWAVAADGLNTSLTLAVMDKVQEATDAMSAATDQMTIEECTGPILQAATAANFEAALDSADALLCAQKNDLEPCAAGAKWRKKGQPLIATVKELSKTDPGS